MAKMKPSSPINDTLQLPSSTDGLKDELVDEKLRLISTSIGRADGFPWTGVKSKFFPYLTIQPIYWDKLFPYRLLVVNAHSKNGNTIVGGSSEAKVSVVGSAGNAIVNFQPLGKKWVFTLPISPQQLAITDQFAINTSATLRGVVEEHGGVRFKLINASGTMGVWPHRTSVTNPPSSPNILQSIFGGTIESAENLAGQFKRVINAATSDHPAEKPETTRPESDLLLRTSTGYYQALALQQFLEQYAEAKKDPNNAGWRLVFDIPKQNQSFVVTPMQFNWNQNANKPMEIQYALQFKAWRRIDLQEPPTAVKPDISSISPGILQRILTTISEARKLMSASIDLIGAVRSDVTKPLDVLRQTSLFVKDLAGVVVTAADLPFQIQKDYASSIKESMNILKDSISTTSSDSQVRSSLSAVSLSSSSSEGLSLNAIAGGQLGKNASMAQSIDPSNNIFKEPERNFTLMDQVPVFSLSLTDAQQSQVDQILENARSVTVDDLKSFRSTIMELALQLSNTFGAGDAYFSQVYGKPTPKSRIQPMTLDEYDILNKLYDVISSYDDLTATTEVDDINKRTNMEYVSGLADIAEIPFNVPTSKILAPVPFGLTIEAIALRYLGDAQRWLEIVTLNNLRAPYIDENGFQRTLLSNATGRQITISSVENLYIGQRVVLRSTSQTPSARRILGIDQLSETSYLLTLDGEADLNNFVTADSAYLQAYLPGTVNSQQKIFIPSDLPVSDDPNIVPPASTLSDPLVGLSKVDWLLTDSGDIAANNFGDFRLAAGMTNLIQAIKIKIGTRKGTIISHPGFGLGIRPGMMASEVDAQEIYNTINTLVQDDPRYEGLESLQISINGPKLSISMGVILAGVQGVFPLTFELPA